MITVFYDGKCGLCSREIQHYKRIAPSHVFIWHDLTVNPEPLEKFGISYAQGLKILHATDQNERLYIGVDAFLLMWRQMKRWHIFASIVGNPLIRPVANVVYGAFAAWRFKRLTHCQLALKSTDS